MHLRRALLLFAIVLMLAALATSVSRPQRDREPDSPPPTSAQGPPEAAPGPDATVQELRVPGAKGARTVRLTGGSAATLVVSVEADGQVTLPDLGLTEPATPLAPARFELIGDIAGTFEIRFTPADGGESRHVGRLIVDEEPL